MAELFILGTLLVWVVVMVLSVVVLGASAALVVWCALRIVRDHHHE